MKKIGVHLLSDKFRLIKKDPPLLQLPWLMSVGVVGLQFSVFLGSWANVIEEIFKISILKYYRNKIHWKKWNNTAVLQKNNSLSHRLSRVNLTFWCVILDLYLLYS